MTLLKPAFYLVEWKRLLLRIFQRTNKLLTRFWNSGKPPMKPGFARTIVFKIMTDT